MQADPVGRAQTVARPPFSVLRSRAFSRSLHGAVEPITGDALVKLAKAPKELAVARAVHVDAVVASVAHVALVSRERAATPRPVQIARPFARRPDGEQAFAAEAHHTHALCRAVAHEQTRAKPIEREPRRSPQDKVVVWAQRVTVEDAQELAGQREALDALVSTVSNVDFVADDQQVKRALESARRATAPAPLAFELASAREHLDSMVAACP